MIFLRAFWACIPSGWSGSGPGQGAAPRGGAAAQAGLDLGPGPGGWRCENPKMKTHCPVVIVVVPLGPVVGVSVVCLPVCLSCLSVWSRPVHVSLSKMLFGCSGEANNFQNCFQIVPKTNLELLNFLLSPPAVAIAHAVYASSWELNSPRCVDFD